MVVVLLLSPSILTQLIAIATLSCPGIWPDTLMSQMNRTACQQTELVYLLVSERSHCVQQTATRSRSSSARCSSLLRAHGSFRASARRRTEELSTRGSIQGKRRLRVVMDSHHREEPCRREHLHSQVIESDPEKKILFTDPETVVFLKTEIIASNRFKRCA